LYISAAFVRRSECVPQPDRRQPLVGKPGVLPGADMRVRIYPAWKDERLERPASALQIVTEAVARGVEQLELNGAAGFLLDDHRPRSDTTAADHVADPHLHEITAAKLVFDRQNEERAIA